MKGVPRDDLLGTDVDDWVADETVGRADELRRELDAGARDVGTIEYEFVAGNGERFPAEIRFTRVDDDRFGFSRVGMIRDATERATRERRLQQQNDRLDEFAAIASHDLRNPLNVAEGRLELARQEHDSEHLASIERAHDRIRSLIDDLLTLARPREDTLDLTTVSLSTLAEHCWDSVERGSADRPSADDVVANGGSEVTATVGDLPDGFFVADDGRGTPPEAHDQVFEAGYSTNPAGTGFGLSIVREIAEAHGWDVRLTEADGGGVRFEFRGVTAG
jgi:PAS domain S-box-containing protein